MFSFFKSTKKSPIASPTAELQKADDATQRNSDEFVLIGNNNPSPYHNRPLYPSAQLPARPPPPNPQTPSFSRQVRVNYLNYYEILLNSFVDFNFNKLYYFNTVQIKSIANRI